jgi:acetyl esterase/lipase
MLRTLTKTFVCAVLFLGAGAAVHAQSAAPQIVLLWPDGAPGAMGTEDVDKPSLTIFPASGAERVPTAVIICPGGSYLRLSMDKEGSDVAKWLNERGITAFVLKYRLGPKYHHPVELGDAQRAIRYVRSHAKDYGYDEKRIGIWGFSAGGHLASTTGTHFDAGKSDAADPIERQSSRPDFMILAYPVITLAPPYVHLGSRNALLGRDPDAALIESLSNEKQVTASTPPTFLFHTTEDHLVPVENSIYFYLALRKAEVPAEMHIFQKGEHGVGLAPNDPVLKTWPDLLADWLKAEGFR